MSRQEFSVSYHSWGKKGDHSIDVQVLAPALLAFGRPLKEANTEINGDRASARVLVVSDFEHKCFNINFELIVGWLEHIKTLIGTEDAKSAKEILEWVGIIGAPLVAGPLSLLQYLKWKRGRKVDAILETDSAGTIKIMINGNTNSVRVHKHVYALSQNPKALRATRDAFLPLGQDGLDFVRLQHGDEVVDEIDEEDVEKIVASCNEGITASKDVEPDVEVTPAWITVYSPVYDMREPEWRFRLGTQIISADIASTEIAGEALERGGALAEDAYQVRLEIITDVDALGTRRPPRYRVLEVIRFVPAAPSFRQVPLFDEPAADPES